MTMVEIDPDLFLKCRLCLENSGIYHIVPTVRHQISYCFEINIEPFDGLPQVICKKCQLIVSDVTNIKRSFIKKQDDLQKHTLEKNALQKKEQVKPVSAGKRENSTEVATYESKRRKTSTSSNHSEHNSEFSKLSINNNQNWCKEYQKIFSCTICNSQWVTKESAKHHNSKHKNLKTKYPDIFRRYSVVQLQKIDGKHNMIGSIDHVVYSKSRIIAKGNSDYYISYKYAVTNMSSDTDNESKNGGIRNFDESTDENTSSRLSEMRNRRRKRRRRICSRSSTETVVLENNSNRKSQENDCISIDDTDSDDEQHKIVKASHKNISNTNMQAVSRLITATYNKYLKRLDKPENPSIEQLNRKIISIGRQIINKRGFNCTRLIKYLEHLNLSVIWLTRSPLNVTCNSNFYKIIPRHKYASEKNLDSFVGYRKIYDKPIQSQETLATTTKQEAEFEDVIVNKTGSVIASDIVDRTGHQLFCDTTLVPMTANGESSSNTLLEFNIPYHDTKKLLNANPVANPRQLPKKFISESKKDIAKPSLPSLEVEVDEVSPATSSGCENNIQMPIIVYTTSLAPVESNEASSNNFDSDAKDDSNNENPKPAPRIKVKSVAELMSKETLSRMQESTSVTQTQQQQMSQNGTECTYGGHELTMATIQNIQSFSPRDTCNEQLILDTIELPNTKTKSPIAYFRSLLQVHNLTLLKTDAILTNDFRNLLKFKVIYQQETKVEPVILSLSLFCANKTFCLKIKDRNEMNINMSKISANWQWEVLKICRGDVATKMLDNAKKVSQEVYKNTNSFVCLLKSIKFIARIT